MSRILFLVCFLFSSSAGANETAIQNDTPPRRQVLLFEHMQTTHTDFSINVPNENVNIQASYFNQVDITGGQWTRAVTQQAAEIFILWANERGFELTDERSLPRRTTSKISASQPSFFSKSRLSLSDRILMILLISF